MTELQTMPVKIMRAEDWKKLATAINPYKSIILDLMERWEHFIHQPLKKGDFVNEVEKPKRFKVKSADQLLPDEYVRDCDAYESAQDALVFEGFEKDNVCPEDFIRSGDLFIDNRIFHAWINQEKVLRVPANPTRYDFIYQVDLYNRTATNKINLNFTKEFLKKVIEQ